MRLESLKHEPVGTLAFRQLRDIIRSGTWLIGERIPSESMLSSTLGVGRSTVREAVRSLVHAGLLETRPGDGTYVRANNEIAAALESYLEAGHVLEVYEVRRALELEAALLAVQRRSDKDLLKMREALNGRHAHSRALEPRAFLDADMDFHLAIVDAAGNPVLAVMYRGLIDALTEALVPVVQRNFQESDTDELHEELYRAIESRSPEDARVATLAHLDSTERAIELARDAVT